MTTEIKNNGGSLIEIKVGGIVVAKIDGTGFTLGTAEPYIYVRDEKASGTSGGVFTGGGWRTRTLNTKVVDTASIATLSINQLTLPAGTYRFRARAPVSVSVGTHKARLYNATDAVVLGYGNSGNNGTYTSTIELNTGDATVMGRFTLSGPKAIELQHYCQNTNAFGDGFGLQSTIAGAVEVYAELELWKERV